ncbi:hypothetical protein IW146_004053 [Coemansia sp. RSA 922]|nr:hypothetical protein H4S03_005627 [Coemansia sp. S3946]KAJ2069716.1 hypothetical protein GGH13_004419 [Coemansia sp. S155-1]KAJ2113182.1 hypothetical protein IW146_004053 [Coemansia sp. RSA 922]KAJ2346433.1 hypothetical protein GGH92_003604 [Coemansia sp. RSA 2673]
MSALLRPVIRLACSRGTNVQSVRFAHVGDFAVGVKRRALPTTTSIAYTIPTDAYLLAKKFQEVARQGKLDDAVAIVMQTKTRSQSVVVWNLVIDAYAKEGRLSRALRGYSEMRRRGFMPTPTTFTALLKACALSDSARSKEVADELFRLMEKQGVDPSIINANSLMSVYQRKHDMEAMLERFNNMPEDGPMAPSLATYTILMSSLRRELLARLDELSGKAEAAAAKSEGRVLISNSSRTARLKENVHRTFDALLQVWTSFVEDVDRRLSHPVDGTALLSVDAHIVNIVLKACHAVYRENRALGRRGFKVIEKVYGLDQTFGPLLSKPMISTREPAVPLAVRIRQQSSGTNDLNRTPVLDDDTINLTLDLCTRDEEYTKAIRFWRSLEAYFAEELQPLKKNHTEKIEALYARLNQPRPR